MTPIDLLTTDLTEAPNDSRLNQLTREVIDKTRAIKHMQATGQRVPDGYRTVYVPAALLPALEATDHTGLVFIALND